MDTHETVTEWSDIEFGKAFGFAPAIKSGDATIGKCGLNIAAAGVLLCRDIPPVALKNVVA